MEPYLADVHAALARRGLEWRQVELLSSSAWGRKRERRTFRIDLSDGSTLKARRFESAADAARVAELRRQTPPGFVPVLACDGPVLLEGWVNGEALSPEGAAERAEEVGAMLGRLHAVDIGAPRVTTESHRERAREQLGQLAEAGALSPEPCVTLMSALERLDPGASVQTLVHLDYAPENLVVDPAGGLHVVDNEWIRIDAPGRDLGRTWARWRTSGDVWSRFVRGYRTTATQDPGPLGFWKIVMAAHTARIRLEQSPATLPESLARLHELGHTPVRT